VVNGYEIHMGYLHGLFDHPDALAALLAWAGVSDAERVDLSARRQADLDRLADSLEASLDLPRLAACFGPGRTAEALLATAPAKLA
jgi:adenosylcobyric acid synthase